MIDDLLPQLQLLKVGDRIAQVIEATIGFLRVRAVTGDAVGRNELRGLVGIDYSAEGKQHRHAHRGKSHLIHAMSVSQTRFMGENVPVLLPNRSASTPNHCSVDSHRFESGTRL